METIWGGGWKESSSAHENPYSLVPLKNKANLTTREVSLLVANSAFDSVGYSFTIGIKQLDVTCSSPNVTPNY